ncbi:MAG TPA: NUDIX domain-containing protein [Acidimicrobiia bacterium]|nr:NUDIX domain-containing protein [Acidimicrobiia bacterium]
MNLEPRLTNGPVVAVGAVAVVDDTILLVRRGRGPAQGEWSVPGGRVEAGEAVHLAVVREAYEETGLEVVVDRFLGWVERIGDDPLDGTPHHFVILDFAVTPLDPTQPLVAGDDAAEARWVPLADITDLRLVDGLYEFLRDTHVID